jgi:serine protease Do
MEALKKTAVLITGLLIIILVTWILSLSSEKSNDSQLKGKAEPQSQESPGQTPSATEENDSSPATQEPGMKRPSNEPDTIAWRTFSDVEPQNKEYTFSGKMPLSGNPNPIFTSAAKRILPAVVSIRSSRRIKHPSLDFFPHFFPPKDNEEKKKGEEDEIIQPGSGSGIILSEDGYIMTNYHVVEQSERIQVVLYDKREFDARMVGGDPTTDVALLKIKDSRLPVAMMGNSDSVQIGEWVMAVGNPLNFTSTITSGIVSALGRNINIIDPKYRYRIEHFIQTDAVINPGNSGGALINLSGEVIGINTAIATRNGFYQGYGFAIPINLARKVVNDLLRYGRVRRAILGVVIEPVTDNIAKAVGLPRPTGALIQSVTGESPAEKAGLRQGDIILAVEGEEVVSVNDLQTKIARHLPGEIIDVTIWRGRREMNIEIELGEAPPANEPVSQNRDTNDTKFENLGITFRNLSEEEKPELNISGGLFVEKVTPGSPAAQAGLFAFLIVVAINDQPVSTIADFNKILKQAKPGEFLKMNVKDSRLPGNSDSRILFVEVK